MIAELKINGTDCGILWKPPFESDISTVARPGTNTIEIKVTNLWPNRLIGDEQLPPIANGASPTVPSPLWSVGPRGCWKESPAPPDDRRSRLETLGKDAALFESGLFGRSPSAAPNNAYCREPPLRARCTTSPEPKADQGRTPPPALLRVGKFNQPQKPNRETFMKTRTTHSHRRFKLEIFAYGNSYYIDRVADWKRRSRGKPRTLQLDMVGVGEISADAALRIRATLLARSPRTQIITNARSSLQNGSVLRLAVGRSTPDPGR